MAEEITQGLSTTGSTAKQPLKVEAFQVVSESVDGSSKATITQVKQNRSMSEGSNNRSSPISDTESMDPDHGSDDEYDDDVEPDSIPSHFGSAFVSVPQVSSYPSTLKNSKEQAGLSGAYAFSLESSMSETFASEPVKEPLTIVQEISETYHRRRRSEEADFLKTIDRVSTLEQEMEMLSLQKKDLRQQVKLLKEDNDRLKSTPDGVLEDQNRRLVQQVNHLQENLRQAVERMYHYQSRCDKYELRQTERVLAGPPGTSSYGPSTESFAEPDTMPCLQDLSSSPPDPVHCSDDKLDQVPGEEEEEDEKEKEKEKEKEEDTDTK